MRPLLLLASISASILFLQNCLAQDSVSSGTAQPAVVMTKLAPLRYPPLARQARISGDVSVNVQVRADGTVASVELLNGHPLLAPEVVENAKKSEFSCSGCAEATSYQLTYSFGFIEDLTPYDKVEDRPARAAKCAYLWKCGVVRVHTFDLCSANLPAEISQSPGHVKILGFPVCIETVSSLAASR